MIIGPSKLRHIGSRSRANSQYKIVCHTKMYGPLPTVWPDSGPILCPSSVPPSFYSQPLDRVSAMLILGVAHTHARTQALTIHNPHSQSLQRGRRGDSPPSTSLRWSWWPLRRAGQKSAPPTCARMYTRTRAHTHTLTESMEMFSKTY